MQLVVFADVLSAYNHLVSLSELNQVEKILNLILICNSVFQFSHPTLGCFGPSTQGVGEALLKLFEDEDAVIPGLLRNVLFTIGANTR